MARDSISSDRHIDQVCSDISFQVLKQKQRSQFFFVIAIFLMPIDVLVAVKYLFLSFSSAMRKPGKVIIDTDAGGDDAAAIFLALRAEEYMKNVGFEVIAITCTYGNTLVTNVEQNVLKILTIANRSDVSIFYRVVLSVFLVFLVKSVSRRVFFQFADTSLHRRLQAVVEEFHNRLLFR